VTTSESPPDATRRDDGPPRGPIAARLAPAVIIAATLACIAWSAWPALRPAPEVDVLQLVLINTPSTTLGEGQVHSPIASASGADFASINTDNIPSNTQPIQAPGWLEADPYAVACSALIDGVVEQILVLEGDAVTEGQVVAKLIADDARLALARAEASLAGAQAEVLRAQAERTAAADDYEQAIEPQRQAALAAAQVDEAAGELARLPMQVASAEATLRQLEVELEQVTLSSAVRAATELEVVIATQRAEAQRHNVAALRSEVAMLNARLEQAKAERNAAERRLQLRIDDRRRLDTAEADLATSQARLALAQAARDEARLTLDRTSIRSPITGVVQKRYVRPGDKVTQSSDDPHGSHIVLLYNPAKLQARVDVPLADAAHLRVGQRCEITVEVLPNRTFTGTLTRITHEADIQRNTLQVKVRLHDPSPILRPEMLARVRFLPASDLPTSASSPASSPATSPSQARRQAQANTARVPASAVERTAASSSSTSLGTARILTVRERRGDRGRIHELEAVIIAESNDTLTLAADFSTGDLLVLRPQDVSPGQRVRTRSPRQASAKPSRPATQERAAQ